MPQHSTAEHQNRAHNIADEHIVALAELFN